MLYKGECLSCGRTFAGDEDVDQFGPCPITDDCPSHFEQRSFTHPDHDPATVTISGSWGVITADRSTGFVIDRVDEEPEEGNDAPEYADIVRFNPANFRSGVSSYDILELGFWDRSGTYTWPMAWAPDFEGAIDTDPKELLELVRSKQLQPNGVMLPTEAYHRLELILEQHLNPGWRP